VVGAASGLLSTLHPIFCCALTTFGSHRSHGDDDIALFVTLFNIAVGFDDLLQWTTPVDHRFQLSRLDQLFEEEQIINLGLTQFRSGIFGEVEVDYRFLKRLFPSGS
jgi:hypothetical protein